MSSSFAISSRCVTAYRVAIGFLCAWELADKYEALPGLYSDDGSLPRSTVMPEARGEGRLVWLLCVHAWRGELLWTQALVGLQCVAAACVALGYHPVASSLLTWWLHCSFCWRNASLVYILDRYIHLLLLYSAFMSKSCGHQRRPSAVACVLALQLLVIYTDAGYFKAIDPARAWSVTAPVAALDTYMRHTWLAQNVRHLLGATGLRLAGAATVGIELFVPWVIFFVAPTLGIRRFLIAIVCSLHVGIALTMRNTTLLSAAAIIAWIPFWDMLPASREARRSSARTSDEEPKALESEGSMWARLRPWVLAVYVALSVHHQALGKGGVGCAGRTGEDAVRTLLFHQRWNVFSSAEDYVVWEVAPARLDDGSIIDIWRGTEDIAWAVPRGFDEPAYRRGRWRAWPYTALRDEAANVHFWSMLCDDFERRDSRGRSVLGFHFYMMQADAVPIEKVWETSGDEYGDVRKRLIQKWDCTTARDARAKMRSEGRVVMAAPNSVVHWL